jgi:hypothetical protein
MSRPQTIDVHAYILTEETAGLLRKNLRQLPVTITPIDNAAAALDLDGVVYRPFPRGGFDIARQRVLLASDYPYDMAMLDCTRRVRSLAISENDKGAIFAKNAEGLPPAPGRSGRR